MNREISALQNLNDFFNSQPMQLMGDFFNSSFSSALCGALVGALAANQFAKRGEKNMRLERQLFACNSATSMALATFQHSLGFKKQLTKETVATFRENKSKFEEHLRQVERGAIPASPPRILADFRSIGMFQSQVSALEELVMLKCSTTQDVATATAFLSQSLHALEQSIEDRQDQLDRIELLKTKESKDTILKIYFGIPRSGEVTDHRLMDSIDHIEVHNDNCIHYALFIATKMSAQAQTLADSIGGGAQEPVKFSITNTEILELLPKQDEYPDFAL